MVEPAGPLLLDDPSLPAGIEVATEVPAVTDELLLSGAVLAALCAGAALGDADVLAEEDGLAEVAADSGAAVLAGLLLVQLPWVSELVVAFAAEAPAPESATETVAVAFGLLVVLVPLLGLAGVLLPAAGLAGELGAAGVGGTGVEAEALVAPAELADADADADAVREGDAGACGHDEMGVGTARCFAAVVRAAATPPLPSACPPPPAAGAAAELADGWLLSTFETDEATAWRSGGTDASTTPTTNTAQATAMAGLSTAIRQSRGRCWARPGR